MTTNQITTRAVLVHPLIGVPGNAMSDRNFTKDIVLEKQLGEQSGRWVRQLFPNEALKPITKFVADCRRFHNGLTLYWPDEGWGMLPTAMHQRYTSEMTRRKGEFEKLRDDFLSRFPEWVQWAQHEHGNTFDMSFYDAESARAKFIFTLEFRPIPESSQFVSSISDLLGTSASEVDQQVQSAVETAKRDLLERLRIPVQHMVNKLRDPLGQFRDSLTENIKEVAQLIPQLDITNDTALRNLADEAAAHLASQTPESLRTNPILRQATADKAEELARKMRGLFGN